MPEQFRIITMDGKVSKELFRVIRNSDNKNRLVVESESGARLTIHKRRVLSVDSLGKAIALKPGSDVTLITLGDMVSHTLKAAEALATQGVSARVVDMHTIKPLDIQTVLTAAEETGAIVTVEDHNYINGLGSAVAEVLVENAPVPMARVGIKDTFAESGAFDLLLKKYEMDAEAIVAAAKDVLRRAGR